MKRKVILCDSRESRIGKRLLYNSFLAPIKQTCPFMTASFVLASFDSRQTY